MKTYQLLSVAIILMLFGACAPTYNPTPSNPALLKEKGEAKFSGSLSGSAFSLQGAAALSDHFALNSTLNTFSNSYSINGREYTSRGLNWDIMPGYFTTFNETGVFEVFGGLGLSSVNGTEFEGNLTKLYIQPSIGWAGDYTEGALTFRLTELLIPETNTTQRGGVFFIEPMATIRFGGPMIKGITQFGVTFPPGYLGATAPVDFNPFIINVGVQVQIRN